MPVKKGKDPLRSAAILKVSFALANNLEHPQFRAIYDGVLRDFKLEDQAVDKYIAVHREALEQAARGKAAGEDDEA